MGPHKTFKKEKVAFAVDVAIKEKFWSLTAFCRTSDRIENACVSFDLYQHIPTLEEVSFWRLAMLELR